MGESGKEVNTLSSIVLLRWTNNSPNLQMMKRRLKYHLDKTPGTLYYLVLNVHSKNRLDGVLFVFI